MASADWAWCMTNASLLYLPTSGDPGQEVFCRLKAHFSEVMSLEGHLFILLQVSHFFLLGSTFYDLVSIKLSRYRCLHINAKLMHMHVYIVVHIH